MIDLKRYYTKNIDCELRDLYLAECKKQGFEIYSPETLSSFEYLYVSQSNKGDCVMSCTHACVVDKSPLKISDLKPKPFLQTGEAFEHTKTLNFILERMINVHGEKSNVDYIHKLRNAIMFVEKMEEPTSIAVSAKPKKTKVDYVKVDKNTDGGKYWECARQFAEGECEFFHSGLDKDKIDANDWLLFYYSSGQLYRKVETEVTWQGELKDHVEQCTHLCELNTIEDAMNTADVNGCWDKEFIEMCRIVVNATK